MLFLASFRVEMLDVHSHEKNICLHPGLCPEVVGFLFSISFRRGNTERSARKPARVRPCQVGRARSLIRTNASRVLSLWVSSARSLRSARTPAAEYLGRSVSTISQIRTEVRGGLPFVRPAVHDLRVAPALLSEDGPLHEVIAGAPTAIISRDLGLASPALLC